MWSFQKEKEPGVKSAGEMFSLLRGRGVIKQSGHQTRTQVQMSSTVHAALEQISMPESSGDEYLPSSSEYLPSSSEYDETDEVVEHDKGVSATAKENSSFSSTSPPIATSSQFGMQLCQVAEKRVYDKKHCCIFCNKLISKLARHLEQMHASEPEVAMALMFPKCSLKRKEKLGEILKKGDFAYNKKVIETKSGLIIARKRPTKNVDINQYLPCCHCFGMYLRKDLWRHVKNCHQKENKHLNVSHQVSGKMLLPVSYDVSYKFKSKILSTMVMDEITSLVMGDPLILAFGERLFIKVGAKQHQYNYVKQKLRELARFLLNIKSNKPSGIKCLKDCFDPAKFSKVIASVKDVCKCDEDGIYGIPSLALKIGHSLKKCALLLKSQALQDENVEMKQKALSFLELYASDWSVEIASASLQTIHERLYNKPKRIPLAQDLKLFSEHLEEKACSLKNSLDGNHEPDIDVWKELNEVTLCQIVLFNRRRGGETERIKVTDFEEGVANNTEIQEEVFAGLSSFEKQLASTLDRIEIRGKRGRKVAVLLTKRHKERIDCLLQHRSAVGVNPDNIFLFARCGDSLTSIRSCDVLRKYAASCGAKQPSLLTSTALRKHVATISQILNLKNHELDTLANFLGHDIRVHRDFYRLPEDTVQLAKVSKILVELENGNIGQYAGKSLEQIDMDCSEELHESEIEQEIPDDGAIEELEMPDDGAIEATDMDLNKEAGKSVHVGDRNFSCMSSKKMTSHRKTQVKRKGWNSEEKDAVERQLGKYFTLSRLPGKFECEEAKRKEPALKQRPWAQIKFFIKNAKNKSCKSYEQKVGS